MSDARAGEYVLKDRFSSGTSLEEHELGAFNPYATEAFSYFWFASETNDIGTVVEYAEGEAYDYQAHGLERNPYLEESEPTQKQYFNLFADVPVHRSIFGRESFDDASSNVIVRTGTRESIYCDLLTQFTSQDEYPVPTPGDRLLVWVLREDDGDVATTNLMVTAGCFTNGFRAVSVHHFRLDFDIDLSRWYRLTIRAHGDVSAHGIGLAGFSIYIDGQPVSGKAETYEICDPRDVRAAWLEPEARALSAARRLFPGLATPGTDAAHTISGLAFSGDGRVDDISFSSEDPGYAKPEVVFTLNWDAGISSLKYASPAAGGGVVTNTAPVETARSVDILMGPAEDAGRLQDWIVTAVEATYNAANGYTNGLWFGSNGAKLTNETAFVVVDASTRNPIGNIVSSREFISIGGAPETGSVDTFAEAFEHLDRDARFTNAVKVIVLEDDFVIARGSKDQGAVRALNPEGDYVLDLNGHTLKGTGRVPTINVTCRSFRICDSSEFRTGCVKPVEAITNANVSLNTAVLVYPQKGLNDEYLQPVLTLQGGTYDGWIRNDGKKDYDASVKGTVIVEGGRYLATNSVTFYLESCVTNTTALALWRDGYWSILADEDSVIWTGLGDGLHWRDPENWKGRAVPTATDTALFPSTGEPWTVDLGDGDLSTKDLWLEGDVFLSGTNDFLGVNMKGLGRFCGTATLIYAGDQPSGKLTETTLRSDWSGVVFLKNIGTSVPKVLKNPETWGTASSTVAFENVCGYVMDINSHTMPYDLLLMRDLVVTNGTTGAVTTNYAWRNDSGYTGSTLAFTGALLGEGTLRSGANARAVLQVLKFADVKDYYGQFLIDGKRVLVGSDRALASDPGLIAFGDQAIVNAGLGWSCQRASFGSTLFIQGQTNDVLVTAKAEEPDVTVCSNVYLNGRANIAWLACTNQPKWSVYVTGDRPAWIPEPDPEEPVAAFAPNLFAWESAPEAGDDAYSTAAFRATARAMAILAVESADVALEITADEVHVVVRNASRGLWYGVRHRVSLGEAWEAPVNWVQATGPSVTMVCPKEADAGFYGVVVSYEPPQQVKGSNP